MKEVCSSQEIGTRIDQGIQASFTRHHIVAHVTVSQLPDSDRIQAVMLLSLGQYNITVCEREYEDIAELLDILILTMVRKFGKCQSRTFDTITKKER